MGIFDLITQNRKWLEKLCQRCDLSISRAYQQAVLQFMQSEHVKKALQNDANFTLSGNRSASAFLDKILAQYSQKATNIICGATLGAYERGENSTIKAVSILYGNRPHAQQVQADVITNEAIDDRRKQGLNGHKYITAKRGGMTISARVWNLNQYTRKEMEILVQNCQIQGLSADKVSRETRQYLNNPSSLFRRVRDKDTGELKLSQSAQNYHPGQGVYRSAYKNAMRLSRTEINNAYRAGEWQSYQDNQLIKGFEIRLSNNHTMLNSKGQPVPFHDICDELAGVYPKTFKWTGWHPQCRCVMIPITISDEEFGDLMAKRREAKLFGRDPDSLATPGLVDGMPDQFKTWMDDNEERLANARRLPQWLADNTNPDNPNLGAMDQTINTPAQAERVIDKLDDFVNDPTGVVKLPDGEVLFANTSEQKQLLRAEATSWMETARNIAGSNIFDELIGSNPTIKHLYDLSQSDDIAIAYNASRQMCAIIGSVREKEYVKQNPIGKIFQRDGYIVKPTAYMPHDFNSEYQAQWNKYNVELENTLGVIRTPMNYHKADHQRVNPNINAQYPIMQANETQEQYKDRVNEYLGYSTNCQTCVVVQEMRIRGYDVEALSNENFKVWNIIQTSDDAWRTIDNDVVTSTRIIEMEGNLLDSLLKNTKENERYTLRFTYAKNGAPMTGLNSGHIVCLERIGDYIRINDPQTGVLITDIHEYQKGKCHFDILRIDNLKVNPDLIGKMIKAKHQLR